jgi:hypothetical protein
LHCECLIRVNKIVDALTHQHKFVRRSREVSVAYGGGRGGHGGDDRNVDYAYRDKRGGASGAPYSYHGSARAGSGGGGDGHESGASEV